MNKDKILSPVHPAWEKTDKIQEELEKEIEKIDVKNHWAEYSEGNGFCETCVKLWELKAKLSQHIATKQAMIKVIDEQLDKHIHVVDDCDCCKQNVKNLYKFKQKLGECQVYELFEGNKKGLFWRVSDVKQKLGELKT